VWQSIRLTKRFNPQQSLIKHQRMIRRLKAPSRCQAMPSTADLFSTSLLTFPLTLHNDGKARPRRRAQRNRIRGRYRQNGCRNHSKESQTITIKEQICNTQSNKGDSESVTIRTILRTKCQKQAWRDDYRVWDQESLQARSSDTSKSPSQQSSMMADEIRQD
jgi:hypothetical protein